MHLTGMGASSPATAGMFTYLECKLRLKSCLMFTAQAGPADSPRPANVTGTFATFAYDLSVLQWPHPIQDPPLSSDRFPSGDVHSRLALGHFVLQIQSNIFQCNS